MERLNQQVLHALAADHAMALCGPDGSAAHAGAVSTLEVPRRPLPVFLAAALWASLARVIRNPPAFVMAGSGLTAPIAWLCARLTRARAIAYVHGLDLVVEHRLYRHLWLPFIRHCDLVIANSANTRRLAIERGVPQNRVTVLHPGTQVGGRPSAASAAAVRDRYALKDAPILLSVGRLTVRKGLVPFVEESLPRIVSEVPHAILVVVGGEAEDALKGGGHGVRAQIETAAHQAGLSAHVRCVGRCDDATLSALFHEAAAHVFPILDLPGDVEGFGMVAIEAAAHGVLTAAFRVGGVPEAVADGVSGHVVEAGNYSAFAEAVLRCMRGSRDPAVHERCREFADGFSWSRFDARLRGLIRSLEH